MPKVYDPILCMMVEEKSKVRDAKKEEGFVIYNATVRGEKLVISYEDLLNNPGKKETAIFTKSEAAGFAKDPWNTWKGNTKSIVEKFIGAKVQDAKDSKSVIDKAIRTMDYKEGEHEGSWIIKIGNDTFELWGEYGANRGNYAKNLKTGQTKKLSGAVGTRQKAYVTIAKAFGL